MPFPWLALAIGGSAVLGAGASIYAADRASDAAKKGGDAALGEQQRQFNAGMTALEPTRALGYGALSDLASLYGYALPGYTPLSSLMNGGQPGSPNVFVGNNGNSLQNALNAIPGGSVLNSLFGGQQMPRVYTRDGLIYFDGRKQGGTLYGGHINPNTGEVWVDNPTGGTRNVELSELATNALRNGTALDDPRFGRLNMALTELQRAGWQYNPNPPAPQAGPLQANTGATIMDRIRNMPGYQFGMTEGIKGIEGSAAARGSVLSSNNLRNVNQFAQDYAGTKFGEEFNRLMAMAGLGQTATNTGVVAGQNYANNAANIHQNTANARASGVMGAANGVAGAINSGLNNWMLYRGGWFNPPAGG